jgi:hypothetical protein
VSGGQGSSPPVEKSEETPPVEVVEEPGDPVEGSEVADPDPPVEKHPPSDLRRFPDDFREKVVSKVAECAEAVQRACEHGFEQSVSVGRNFTRDCSEGGERWRVVADVRVRVERV